MKRRETSTAQRAQIFILREEDYTEWSNFRPSQNTKVNCTTFCIISVLHGPSNRINTLDDRDASLVAQMQLFVKLLFPHPLLRVRIFRLNCRLKTIDQVAAPSEEGCRWISTCARTKASKSHFKCPQYPRSTFFCKKIPTFLAEDWSQVLFSDKTLVKQFFQNPTRVRHPFGARYNARYAAPSVKMSPSFVVWDCMSAQGRGGLWLMPHGSTINRKRYLEILKEKLREWMIIRSCNTFQQDGTPSHRSKAVMNWFSEQQICVLGPWPGNSSDLNPIDHL